MGIVKKKFSGFLQTQVFKSRSYKRNLPTKRPLTVVYSNLTGDKGLLLYRKVLFLRKKLKIFFLYNKINFIVKSPQGTKFPTKNPSNSRFCGLYPNKIKKRF